MKNKIIKINVDDISINPEDQSNMITMACSRETKMQVSGICQVNDNILISLEESVTSSDYQFAPFDSINVDEIATEISTRFLFGFSMVGGFDLKNRKWALLRKMSECK